MIWRYPIQVSMTRRGGLPYTALQCLKKKICILCLAPPFLLLQPLAKTLAIYVGSWHPQKGTTTTLQLSWSRANLKTEKQEELSILCTRDADEDKKIRKGLERWLICEKHIRLTQQTRSLQSPITLALRRPNTGLSQKVQIPTYSIFF